MHSSPYHPASNDAAERLVQMVKQVIEGGHQEGLSVEYTRTTFRLRYRVTPLATTGVPPSELMISRPLRTRLDVIRPDAGRQLRNQQDCKKTQHDLHSSECGFVLGQQVSVRYMQEGPRWVPGVIAGRQGPVSYQVRVASRTVWHQQVDHVRDGTQYLYPTCTSAGKQESDSQVLDYTLAIFEGLSSSTVANSRSSQ